MALPPPNKFAVADVPALLPQTGAAPGPRAPDKVADALYHAWVELQVPQCGYCQSGQLMSAGALLATTPKPTDADIDAAMGGNACRCATYQRIRAGIHRAAELLEG